MGYILGFDGGGTKTECVLMNSASEVLARTLAGPSNSSRIGVDAAVRNVEEAAESALREVKLGREDVSAIGAGLAGTTDADRRERVRGALQTGFPRARILVITDLEAALEAAPQGPAIVLVAGTGSAAIGRNAHRDVVRVGGYGRFGSDEGSAFDIGRRAIAAAVAESEGTGRESPVGTRILQELNIEGWRAVQERAQQAPDDVYPRIFPVIAAAADSGDEAARRLLGDAAESLSGLVADAAARLGFSHREFALVKIGGMLGRSVFFETQLEASMAEKLPGARKGKLRMSPAEAAALMAKDAHGGK